MPHSFVSCTKGRADPLVRAGRPCPALPSKNQVSAIAKRPTWGSAPPSIRILGGGKLCGIKLKHVPQKGYSAFRCGGIFYPARRLNLARRHENGFNENSTASGVRRLVSTRRAEVTLPPGRDGPPVRLIISRYAFAPRAITWVGTPLRWQRPIARGESEDTRPSASASCARSSHPRHHRIAAVPSRGILSARREARRQT